MPNRQSMDFMTPSIRGRMRTYDRPHHIARPVSTTPTPITPKIPAQPQHNVVAAKQPHSVASQPIYKSQSSQVPRPVVPQATSRAHPAVQRAHKPTPSHAVSQPRQLRSNVLQRRAVKKSAAAIIKATRPKFKHFETKALIGLTIVSLLFGVSSSLYAWRLHSSGVGVAGASDLQKPDPDVIQPGGTPTELPPTLDQYKEFEVQPAAPRYVRIPALGVNARVRPLAVAENNQLQAPANVFDAGWFSRSAKPGEVGTMLISAHTAGPNMDGIFQNLTKLQRGNIIEIERGNTEKYRYKVVEIKVFEHDKLDLATAMKPVETGKAELHLVSHGPVFNPVQNKYEPRIVVYAVQM